jgi:hypothetical protein
MMSYKCKECGAEFDSEKSLHAHIKKHNLYLGDYYVKHYPRYNKLTGDPIQFKNKDQYFTTDFSNTKQMEEWCQKANFQDAKDYILQILIKRVSAKNWNYAPCHLELSKAKLPNIDLYRKYYESYNKACAEIGLEPLFKMPLTEKFKQDFDVKVFIDTREQKPLSFHKSESLKLDFGDYTLAGEDFTNTFVDRKSATDFIGTFGKGYERFRKEMQRCVEINGYMYIVTEKSVKDMYKDFFPGKKISTLNWAFSNMVKMQNEFPRKCQFIFTNSREQSESLIPKLLALGKEVWETDVQYYLDKGLI